MLKNNNDNITLLTFAYKASLWSFLRNLIRTTPCHLYQAITIYNKGVSCASDVFANKKTASHLNPAQRDALYKASFLIKL